MAGRWRVRPSSTCFAREKRPQSARRLRDEQLMPLIEGIHRRVRAVYDTRRLTRALGHEGLDVAPCTAAWLMHELGRQGRHCRRRRRTTVPEPLQTPVPFTTAPAAARLLRGTSTRPSCDSFARP
ncbi:IS3 family transposase [Streptomyces sp. NPDC050528]|uniref:IS3 family transposase n=1 Tax=Streptomyces sp. NPDC050528 TaxID=3365623 RepID=UPI0037998139